MSNPELTSAKAGKTALRYIKKIFELQEVYILIPLLALIGIASIFNAGFWDGTNISTIFRRMSMWGLIAVGETLIILIGEIDISVGAMVAFVGVFFSVAFAIWHLPLILAILLAVLLAVVLSAINGFCIVKLKISAFITTIAMLYICKGLAKAMTSARPVPILSEPGAEGFLSIGQSEPLSLSWEFFLFIAVIIVFQIILRKTAYGRKIYATGDNKNVARLAGIKVDRIKISTFLISGVFIGISGVFMIAKEAVGNANFADGLELSVIAATAIGGISLVGGSGTMIGTLIGVIMMQSVSNILILLSVNQHLQSVLLGIIMVLSVIVDVQRRNKLLGKLD